MSRIGNSLYPPIVDTWMPAFLRSDASGCRVYFSLSSYNMEDEININAVQVSVNHQTTNTTALDSDLYPSGIKITTLHWIEDSSVDDRYYIQIFPSDLQQGEFNLDEYYKIQIRFTMSDVSTPYSSSAIDGWLSANSEYFSEWSTVCLIRGISTPIIVLNDFDRGTESEIHMTTIEVVGSVRFSERAESEKLKSYQLLVYADEEKTDLVWQGQQIYTNKYNNPNTINTSVGYEFDENHVYYLGVKITTDNLYQTVDYFSFTVAPYSTKSMEAIVTATPDPAAGAMKVNITGSTPFLGNLTIRRSSYKTNFKVWEDVKTLLITSDTALNFTWYDKTVQSGVWYKYCIQKRNSRGYRSVSIEQRNPAMVVFEDMFLVADDGKQLNIRFDPRVDSFSRVIPEGKTETIGSKYPFIKRNGHTNYRTFSIGGTITAFMDQRNNFLEASRSDIYGDYKQQYDQYNEQNGITLYNDYLYEEKFREKVMDFLYKGNAKLFKSSTEGNILVRLMDISLTPNATLGRLIYSFSCSAHEIDEYSLPNCDKYGVQVIGQVTDARQVRMTATLQGQQHRPSKDITSGYNSKTYFAAGSSNDFVTSILNKKYQKVALPDFVSSIDHLSYLRLELTSAPYLIEIYNGNPRKYTETNTGSGTLILGYIVYINKKPIIINKDGIYELKGQDVRVTSLYFAQNTQGYIDYIVNVLTEEDFTKMVRVSSVKDKIGQLYGYFDLESDLMPRISIRYNQVTYGSNRNTIYEKTFASLDGVRFIADPGTVVYVKQVQDNDLERHVIGQTGVLEFYDTDTNIGAFYFLGTHLTPARDPSAIRPGEYYQTGIILNDLTDVKKPMQGGVYTVAEQAINATYQSITEALQKKNNKYTQLSMRDPDDIVQTQDSIYEAGKHDSSAVPRSHDTLIVDQPGATTPSGNIVSLANAIRLNSTTAGIKILGIYDNDLTDDQPARGITLGLMPYIIGDRNNAFKTNKDYSSVFNNNTITFMVNDLYRALVERVIIDAKKYIFYDGGWYLITDNYDIVRPVTGIVDYYCHYEERRY